MAVEFRVLGTLDVRRDGESMPVRAAVPRTMLAVLLAEHNRVVSVDRLADALWPDARPRSKHALEMTASRVRRIIGDAGTLAAEGGGYVLTVPPESIDSVRFEHLLEEVRALSAVDPARTAARAADALALWRGPAYADFVFAGFAQEESARLEALREEAEEERIAAELALGRGAELLGELAALVAASPLRERRRAHLMLALYRAGRQADALAIYRQTRELLLEQLGLEPGEELRALERAILRQDDSLLRPAAVQGAPTERRPATVVAVEPGIALDLDPEEHERRRAAAAAAVARVAKHFDAFQPEPFVLAFAHEDHAQRAAAAAAELSGDVGIASGEALLGTGTIGGPLVDLARMRARMADDDTAPPAKDAPGRAPFVGRSAELRRIRAAAAAVVVGAPGIGKSRLARELAPDAFVTCRAYGGETLAPLRELCAALGAAAALSSTRADEVPLVVRRVCERSPAPLLVFDDVQWADPLVLETIEQLVAHGHRVVCLAREELVEERPGFAPRAERIVLGPLDDAAALELAGDAAIAARAEGNPLFIEQLAAHAAESGQLPATLQSLLVARLDRLTPVERDAIQRASVVGRELDASLVGARDALESLVRRSLLERVPPTRSYEERFRFRHALIRDAAYESLPREDRSRLHEEVADALAAAGAGDEIVGFHLERAADLRPTADRHRLRLAEDAGRRLGAAGLERWRFGDGNGASPLLAHAIELLPPHDALRFELACELGLARYTSGDVEGGRAWCALARTSRERRIALRAELEDSLRDALEDGDAVSRVLALAEHAVDVFSAVEDERALGRAWALLGWLRGGALGRYGDWLHAAEEALVHYRAADWPVSTCVGFIATALCYGPTPVPVAIARCHELLESESELATEATVGTPLAYLLAMSGDFDAARARLDHAAAVVTDLGRTPSLWRSIWPTQARIARLAGALEDAAATYRRTCETLVEAQAGFHLVTQASELTEVLCELGRFDEAETWAAIAQRHAREPDREGSTAALAARAHWLVAAGDDGALETAHAAVALAEQTDMPDRRASAYVALAGATGDAAHLARALREYERKENTAAAARLHARAAVAAGAAPS